MRALQLDYPLDEDKWIILVKRFTYFKPLPPDIK